MNFWRHIPGRRGFSWALLLAVFLVGGATGRAAQGHGDTAASTNAAAQHGPGTPVATTAGVGDQGAGGEAGHETAEPASTEAVGEGKADDGGQGRLPTSSRASELLKQSFFEVLRGERPDAPGTADEDSYLRVARQLRAEGKLPEAEKYLIALLKTEPPAGVIRTTLLELASVNEALGRLSRAQQIYAQYISKFKDHPSIVETYLRQGDLYRKMGVSNLALAKYYAVMTSALNLRLEQMEYYQRLVLQAQLEIADTHYLEGRWQEAVEFLNRLLKLDSPYLNRAQIQYRLVRALAMLGKEADTVAQATSFLDNHGKTAEAPEVRFLLASTLKKQGRNDDALRQVLLLLESQQSNAVTNPEVWAYWQKRAGNEIGNQLYREGDYLGTLTIYRRLSELDPSAAWQVPVWYQMGLVFERLQQPVRASQVYSNILARETELGGANAAPELQTVVEMTRWRMGNLDWLQQMGARTATVLPMANPASDSSVLPVVSPIANSP